MLKQDLKDILQRSFHDKFDLVERKENLYQLIVPLFHEDGDMMDIFINTAENSLVVCDCGMTIMRLSYTFEIDTKHKEKILFEILSQNDAKYNDGNIYIPTTSDMLFRNIMQLSQIISKVSAMKMLRKNNVASLFYENVQEYIYSSLSVYNPQRDFLPLKNHDEHSVDYFLTVNKKPAYLFAVKGESRALVATVAVMAFQREKLPFTGIAISDDFGSLPVKTQKRIISAMDKLFYDYNDFAENSPAYFERLAQAS